MSIPSPHAASNPSVEAFSDRMLTAALGWMETMAAHVGLEMGWYRALADAAGGLTAPELARATESDPRYTREWLELEAAYGIATVDDPGATVDERRYRLPGGAAEVLLDGDSLAFLGPLAQMLAASGLRMDELVSAYRHGGGVSWSRFGKLAREAQADMNRPWLASLPDVFGRIERVGEVLRRPKARIADVGSGAGWSSIALARAYPAVRVHGFDVDEPSVLMARENAERAGVAERVQFHLRDAARLPEHGAFDAAFAFESLHDMPHPVAVLTAMKDAVGDDGLIVVMDEAVGAHLQSPGDDIDRLMYGYSLFVCLPDGMSHPSSAGTGTVMRPPVLAHYAKEAGLTLDVLHDEFGFWRFYELRSADRD